MAKFAFIIVLLSLSLSQLTQAQNTCISLFKEDKIAEVDLNAVISDESPVSESAIKVAKKLEAVRSQLIKKIGPTVDRKTRETNVKIMESYLRTKAFNSSLKIFRSKKKQDYDAIIIGMGPHALFALTGILSENPNARVLILAADDTAAATFREGYVFSINSSNKPSGNGGKPLPGLGNINELPGLPIQVSDITSVRYPEAADLGDALVANAYALFSTYKNIDIVLGTEIERKQFEKLARQKKEGPVTVDFAIPDLDGSANKTARSAKADFIITATGLGTPKTIDQFIESSRDKRELRKIKRNGLPTVMTFQEFVRMMADSERPWDLLEELNIKVVAPGDSGNVTMEFLLGLASQSAYGSSAVQEKVLRQIGWVGQPLDTCKAFLDKIRNRYSAISSGYKTSDAFVEPPLKAYPQKLLSMSTSGRFYGRTEARLFLEDGVSVDADLVILANGFDKLPADVEAQLKDLKRKTSVSDGSQVLIAKTNPAGTVLITGPSVRLPSEGELKGVIQNFVSLFNNAPRSFATGKYVGRQIKTKKAEDKNSKIQIVPTDSSIRHVVTVEGLELFEGRDFVKNPYFGRINNFNISAFLKSSFETVLTSFDWSTFKNGEVKIHVKRVAEGFEVITNGFANPEVVAALAYNRDFFNPLLSVLSGKTEAIQISAQIVDGQLGAGSAKIYTASIEQPGDDTAQKGIKVKSRVPPYIRELFRDQQQ